MSKKENQAKEVSQVEVHDVSASIFGKRNIVIFGALLLLVLVSAGWLFLHKSTPATKKTATTSLEEQEKVAATKLYNTQKSDLEKTAQSQTKPDEKAVSLQNLSALATQNSDKSAALVYAQKAVDTNASVSSYAVLAYAAEQAGDYKKAIEAYQKAASLCPKTDNPDENTDYNYYNGRAIYLSTKVSQ